MRRARVEHEDGQTMAEYALILAVVFVTAAVGFQLFGAALMSSITSTAGSF